MSTSQQNAAYLGSSIRIDSSERISKDSHQDRKKQSVRKQRICDD